MSDAHLAAFVRGLAKPRYEDVDGAPFNIGDCVTVTEVDNTTDKGWIGLTGFVEYLEYDCGSGQTYPEDPMIGVRFHDGAREEFWANELKRA